MKALEKTKKVNELIKEFRNYMDNVGISKYPFTDFKLSELETDIVADLLCRLSYLGTNVYFDGVKRRDERLKYIRIAMQKVQLELHSRWELMKL